MAQTAILAATEQGLASIEWGAFREAAIQSLLGLSGEELPMLAIGFGFHQDAAKSITAAPADHSPPEPSLLREPIIGDDPAGFVIAQRLRGSEVIATGVGWTTNTAVRRCQGEFVERTSLEQQIPSFYGTAAELGDSARVYPVESEWSGDLPLFDSSNYQAFDTARPYHWMVGETTNGELYYVPTDLVFLRREPGVCARPTSSGAAAHLSESAARQAALYELIERDAFVRAWTSQTGPINISERRQSDFIRQFPLPPNVELRVLDFRAAVPTIGVAILADEYPALSYGMATKTTVAEALEKAFIDAYSTYVVALPSEQKVVDGRPSTPLEHLSYYQSPSHANKIRWFFENHDNSATYSTCSEAIKGTIFISIPNIYSNWHVIRALNPALRSIWFGKGSEPLDARDLPPHFLS